MKTEYDFSKAKRGPVKAATGKTRITIYLDDDVLAHFRDAATREGLGYQTAINRTLRNAMAAPQVMASAALSDASSLLVEINSKLDEMKRHLPMPTQAPTPASSAKEHPPLDPKVADRLLDKLGNDDHFRELFVQDPAAALGRIGLGAEQTENALARMNHMKVAHIIPKTEIQAARDELRSYLTSAAPHFVDGDHEADQIAFGLRA